MFFFKIPANACSCNNILELRVKTSTRFNLKFLCVFSNKKTPGKPSFSFFSPKKLVRLFILREVKPSPDSKIIKLLTFHNLFLPLRHSP